MPAATTNKSAIETAATRVVRHAQQRQTGIAEAVNKLWCQLDLSRMDRDQLAREGLQYQAQRVLEYLRFDGASAATGGRRSVDLRPRPGYDREREPIPLDAFARVSYPDADGNQRLLADFRLVDAQAARTQLDKQRQGLDVIIAWFDRFTAALERLPTGKTARDLPKTTRDQLLADAPFW